MEKINFQNFVWDKCPIQGEDLERFIAACNNVVEEITDEEFLHNFVVAPAAKSHHQNYAGGLVEHSFKLGCYLYSRVLKIGVLTIDQVAKIAICHDFCKVGLYIPQPDGKYEYNPDQVKHHGKLSVEVARRFLDLSQIEKICILLHMAGGWWNNEDEAELTADDRIIIGNNIQLLSAVQWADMKGCE